MVIIHGLKKCSAAAREKRRKQQALYRAAHREERRIKAREYYAAHHPHYVVKYEYGCHLTNEQIEIGREQIRKGLPINLKGY